MLRTAIVAGLAGLTLSLAAPQQAAAQTDPSTLALIERLKPRAGGQTRGIRMPADAATPAATPGIAPETAAVAAAAGVRHAAVAPAAAPARDTTAPEGVSAVSITVNFPSGSATLTPEAERALSPLGQALSSRELASYRFRLEGHTDTVGEPTLNQSLSERRAIAVRNFLESRYGIAPSRLEAAGYGANQLLVQTPAQTNEPRNRRVQVLNIGS